MAGATRRDTDGVPDVVTTRLRAVYLAPPNAYEERAWVGTRWMVRKRTFANLLGVEQDGADTVVVLLFRSEREEVEVLRRAGHPIFVLGWGRDAMGMVLDDPDWDEVAELVTESFCMSGPKRVTSLVDRPTTAEPCALVAIIVGLGPRTDNTIKRPLPADKLGR